MCVYIHTCTTYDIWLIDCLLIALDAHMFSHRGYGPGRKAVSRDLADPTPWALRCGPGPISTLADHMWIKGNQLAINKQYIIGNTEYS